MTDPSPSISVVLASYNGAAFLRPQLDSILGQTLSDLELVVVDDASSDGTPEILREYAGRDRRVRLLLHEANQGYQRTFEHGFREARGRFIAPSDQDDVWEPDKLEVLLGSIEDYDLCFANSALTDAEGVPLGRNLLEEDGPAYHLLRNDMLFLTGNCIPGHGLLATARARDLALPLGRHVVYDRWLGLVAALNAGVRFVPRALTRHRVHASSAIDGQGLAEKPPPSRAERARLWRLRPFRRRERAQRELAELREIRELLRRLGREETPLHAYLGRVEAHLATYDRRFFNLGLMYYVLRNSAEVESFVGGNRGRLAWMIQLCRGHRWNQLFR